MQAQWEPKEGILSRAKPAPSINHNKLQTSPQKPAPKSSYSHVVSRPDLGALPMLELRQRIQANWGSRDPGKNRSPDLSRANPRDQVTPKGSRDLLCNQTRTSHDLPRDWSSTRSQDQPRFRRATRPLINTWQTVGTING